MRSKNQRKIYLVSKVVVGCPVRLQSSIPRAVCALTGTSCGIAGCRVAQTLLPEELRSIPSVVLLTWISFLLNLFMLQSLQNSLTFCTCQFLIQDSFTSALSDHF